MNNIVKKTPLEYCHRLSNKYGAKIFLKREDLQTTRSFKIRGVYNKIIKNLNPISNYVTASAGNHAQGVAYVCNKLNLKCNIFVPENTPLQKISRIKYFGNSNCNLIIEGKEFNECLNKSLDFCNDSNKQFIHPFDDMDVIQGQSMIVSEILNEITPHTVIAPIGGGGLISGLITKLSNCQVYGTEPNGAASMYESIKKNKIVTLDKLDTFVDGASVSRVGNLTFSITKNVKKIFKISNDELCHEIINLYQNEGIIVEPAGALSICGLSQLDKQYVKNKTIVCIISGGNNDLMRYPEIIERSLRYKKLKHYFIIKFKQRPGELKKYIKEVLTSTSDITRFEYIKKNNKEAGSVLIGIELNEAEEINIIKKNMIYNNYDFIELTEDDLLYNYLI